MRRPLRIFTNGRLSLCVLWLAPPPAGEVPGTIGMAEFYVNDVMSHPFTFTLTGTQIGVVDLSGKGALALAKTNAWRMTLPAA